MVKKKKQQLYSYSHKSKLGNKKLVLANTDLCKDKVYYFHLH